jgi:autotransporter translocation and assembly factor TamB
MEMPRGCGTSAGCQVHFLLNANQISLDELSDWVNPSPKERRWYQVLESSGQGGSSFLKTLRASGQVTVNRLVVRNLDATRVSAKVSLEDGDLKFSELNADFLGGKHRGQWQADFSVKPPVCHGSGKLTSVSLARLADVMKDEGIAGSADATYELKGACPAEFWQSAEGTVQFDMREGTLPHFAIAEDTEALKITRFAGQARFDTGKIEIKDARLDSADAKFQLSGAASMKGQLDFQLVRTPSGAAAAGYKIGGTLAEPRVVRSSGTETQAQLKP